MLADGTRNVYEITASAPAANGSVRVQRNSTTTRTDGSTITTETISTLNSGGRVVRSEITGPHGTIIRTKYRYDSAGKLIGFKERFQPVVTTARTSLQYTPPVEFRIPGKRVSVSTGESTTTGEQDGSLTTRTISALTFTDGTTGVQESQLRTLPDGSYKESGTLTLADGTRNDYEITASAPAAEGRGTVRTNSTLQYTPPVESRIPWKMVGSSTQESTTIGEEDGSLTTRTSSVLTFTDGTTGVQKSQRRTLPDGSYKESGKLMLADGTGNVYEITASAPAANGSVVVQTNSTTTRTDGRATTTKTISTLDSGGRVVRSEITGSYGTLILTNYRYDSFGRLISYNSTFQHLVIQQYTPSVESRIPGKLVRESTQESTITDEEDGSLTTRTSSVITFTDGTTGLQESQLRTLPDGSYKESGTLTLADGTRNVYEITASAPAANGRGTVRTNSTLQYTSPVESRIAGKMVGSSTQESTTTGEEDGSLTTRTRTALIFTGGTTGVQESQRRTLLDGSYKESGTLTLADGTRNVYEITASAPAAEGRVVVETNSITTGTDGLKTLMTTISTLDSGGRVVHCEIEGPHGTTTRTNSQYDSFGRLIGFVASQIAGNASARDRDRYDSFGRLIGFVASQIAGNASARDRYNSFGQLIGSVVSQIAGKRVGEFKE